MKTKEGEQANFDTAIANNQSPYGKATYDYAVRWAEMMEKEIDMIPDTMDINEFFKKRANQLSRDADTEGITGFMYGCAVSLLSHCWEYGESLRIWHNLDIQIGDEGEQANQNGGILNPAILNIGEKKQ